MDKKTKEAYDIQYKCIDEIKLIVDEWKIREGRPLLSACITFGCQMNLDSVTR